ncbi:hypothetical protein LOAG_13527, partial [Loa loa]
TNNLQNPKSSSSHSIRQQRLTAEKRQCDSLTVQAIRPFVRYCIISYNTNKGYYQCCEVKTTKSKLQNLPLTRSARTYKRTSEIIRKYWPIAEEIQEQLIEIQNDKNYRNASESVSLEQPWSKEAISHTTTRKIALRYSV